MDLVFGVGLEVKEDTAYNTSQFLEKPHDKFHFYRCNGWRAKFWGAVLAIRG